MNTLKFHWISTNTSLFPGIDDWHSKGLQLTIAYLNDIIIFSKTPQEHLSHIRKVFEKLKSANLSMKKNKCNFFSKEIQYLGHILSATGIRPLPSKTHAIQHMQPPTKPKQV